MRQRRGNYTVLFALSAVVLFGMASLAIDVGRLRVAMVQTEAAADAAALAAVAALRDGRGQADALAAAEFAANTNRPQRLSGGGSGFNVELVYGDWDWDLGPLGWRGAGMSPSAVTVNVSPADPIRMIFTPLLQLYTNQDLSEVGMRAGVQAAMHPRDLVIVVDVSRYNEDNLDDLRIALDAFVTRLESFDIPDDRVGFVIYAGDGMVMQDLEPLMDGSLDLRQAIDDLEPCAVRLDAWYHLYRFFDPEFDPEVPNGADLFKYNAVDPFGGSGGGPGLIWPEASLEGQVFIGQGGGTLIGDWTRDLTPEEQCAAWSASAVLFDLTDPRATRAAFSGRVSPLDCHLGNYWEGRDGRFIPSELVYGVTCTGATSGDSFDIAPGLPAYGIDGEQYFGDLSYSLAGSSPGSGLIAAHTLLTAGPTRPAEPTVLLIAGAGPRCGPMVDIAVDAFDCVDVYDARMQMGADLLRGIDANVHVLALGDAAMPDMALLDAAVAGRGYSLQAPDALSATDLLDVVARDIALKVVR